MRRRTVRRCLVAQLQPPNNRPQVPVRAVFLYRDADPYAVTLAFEAGPLRWVSWTFARDLLAAGLAATSGEGDVRITPDNGDDTRVWLHVASPSGAACFAFQRADLERALDDAEHLVPEGTEAEHFDWDREIAKLGEVA